MITDTGALLGSLSLTPVAGPSEENTAHCLPSGPTLLSM